MMDTGRLPLEWPVDAVTCAPASSCGRCEVGSIDTEALRLGGPGDGACAALWAVACGLHCGEAGALIVRWRGRNARVPLGNSWRAALAGFRDGERHPRPQTRAVAAGEACEALAEAVALDARSEHLGVLYRSDAVTPATAARVASRLVALAEACARHPDAPLSSLAWLPAGESKVLDAFNTPASAPCRGLIHEQIRRKAAAFPARRAVEVLASGADLDYRGLLCEADALAATLAGVVGAARPDRVVAVEAQKTLEMAVFLLGVLVHGAAYVPLDPSWPPQRRAFVAADADAAALVVPGGPAGFAFGGPVVAFVVGARPVPPLPVPPISQEPSTLAYVIYTSGSTGKPKGVMIEHRSVMSLVAHAEPQYRRVFPRFDDPETPPERCAVALNYVFDAFHQSFFFTLGLYAGTCVLVEDGIALLGVGNDANVSLVYDVPSVVSLFDRLPSTVRVSQVGGEAMTPAVAAHALCVGAECWNWYGPTECTINATRRDVPDALSALASIGRPLPGVPCYVVDPTTMCRRPIGCWGELWIGGVQVARGYVNRPELTRERFVPNPFSDGGRCYRTGDRCRFLENGEIEFKGRFDFQLKLRGYRVEPGEIEHALRDVPGVVDAAVVLRDDVGPEPALVGYVHPGSLDSTFVSKTLAAALPAHLVPTRIVTVDAWPRSSSGKIDRGRLPRPASYPIGHQTREGGLRGAVRAVFEEFVGTAVADDDTAFFDLGGSSLGAVRARTALGALASTTLPPRFLFDHPSVAAVVAAVQKLEPGLTENVESSADALTSLRMESELWMASLDDAAARPVARNSASFHASVVLERGCRVGPRCAFGAGCVLAETALVGHDTVFERGCRAGPGSAFGGNVVLREGACVGARAVVAPGVVVGADAVVLADAGVCEDVPSGTTVGGVPAGAPVTSDTDDRVVRAALRGMHAWREQTILPQAGVLRPTGGPVAMVGAGGHCSTLICELRDHGVEPAGCYDDDATKLGRSVEGVAVRGPLSAAPEDARLVLTVGQNEARRAIVERFPGARWATMAHPTVRADASARLGRGTVVEPGAVLGAGVVIGDFVLVGARAILGPGAAVGDYAFVGGGAVVGAGARLGGGCVLGMGAAVLPDRAVGACATVLVASVVYDDVPERAVAAGVPAAPLGASRRTRVA